MQLKQLQKDTGSNYEAKNSLDIKPQSPTSEKQIGKEKETNDSKQDLDACKQESKDSNDKESNVSKHDLNFCKQESKQSNPIDCSNEEMKRQHLNNETGKASKRNMPISQSSICKDIFVNLSSHRIKG